VDTWGIEPVDSSLTLPNGLTSEPQTALNAPHAQSDRESHPAGLPRFDEALRNALIAHRRYWRDFEPNPGERQANDPQGFSARPVRLGDTATRSRPGRHHHVGLLTAERDRKSPGWRQFRPGVAQATASLTRFELNDVMFSM
jgi:hypothetical protein